MVVCDSSLPRIGDVKVCELTRVIVWGMPLSILRVSSVVCRETVLYPGCNALTSSEAKEPPSIDCSTPIETDPLEGVVYCTTS